jgi:protein-export membrane protein SecD
MNRTLQIKLGLIIVAMLWGLWTLWPTIQLAQGTEGKSTEKVASLKEHAIRRGLDLAGGMYLILEVDKDQLAEAEADITEAEALDRVITVIRNRIDEFGVSEPDIRREGTSRVVVQLPGLQDPERAKALIGRTARLTFRMVREGQDVSAAILKIDRVVSGLIAGEAVPDSLASSDTAADSTAQAPNTPVELPEGLNPQHPFSSLVGPYMDGYGGVPVSLANRDKVEALLELRQVQRVLPRDASFLWGTEEYAGSDGGKAVLLYLVEDQVGVSGNEISRATVAPDPDRPPLLMVSIELTRKGGLRFANVTGANVGRKLGIILDEKVHSAPNINEKISGGRASISGGFQQDAEARDLALMLRAGALPADVKIAEERTVGPSLGADSIREGINSVLVGGAAVILFILIYYRAAGALATAGLIMTILLLMAVLAQFGLVLTLPGIAGIILTVGMAVDANVLIFERIREELRTGKEVRAAIDAGYGQATRAIVDANITTFIAALVLFYFGTGPIKGFAVTLAVGIGTSMFSALVFTRTIYDLWLGKRHPKSLSI